MANSVDPTTLIFSELIFVITARGGDLSGMELMKDSVSEFTPSTSIMTPCGVLETKPDKLCDLAKL